VTVLRVRPDAERDVDQAADYYAREADLEIALRFFAAVEDSYEQLLAHPHAGAPVKAWDSRLAQLRFWPVAGFESYLIFYLALPGCVEVVRVLHGAQDLRRILGGGARGG
jgi:plasmid stabilization system protein ParE